MNERGRDVMAELRGFLGRFPGATSMSLTASERWALLLVRAASDEAVVAPRPWEHPQPHRSAGGSTGIRRSANSNSAPGGGKCATYSGARTR